MIASSGIPPVARADDTYRAAEGTADANPHMFTVRSSDNGMTWDDPVQRTDTPGSSDHGSIIGRDRAVYLAWHDSRDGALAIYYRHSTTEGATWDPEDRTSTTRTTDSSTPLLAVTDGYVHALWLDRRSGTFQIYYRRRTAPSAPAGGDGDPTADAGGPPGDGDGGGCGPRRRATRCLLRSPGSRWPSCCSAAGQRSRIERMKPGLRKLALTAHVTSSVGWLGAVVVYLVLAITGLTSDNAQLARAAYLNLESVGWFVVVPFCLAALVTGLVQSLGTEWGLFRHYWILVKFLLTVIGTIVLLGHLPVIRQMSHAAASDGWPPSDLGRLPVQLIVHAAGGLLLLLVATTLSIFKPWGKTRYGRRKTA